MRIPQFSLFLDRDGVINEAVLNDYVKKWSAFKFKTDFLLYFDKICPLFNRIVVVTNQQGVAKGLMLDEDLDEIHQNMKLEISRHGGRIDKIYAATNLKNEFIDFRKPNPLLAYQSAIDYKDIDLKKSIMVGDSQSDIEFGKNAGMKTVLMRSVHNHNGLLDDKVSIVNGKNTIFGCDFVSEDWRDLHQNIHKLFIL